MEDGKLGRMSLPDYERYLDEREAAKCARVLVGADIAFAQTVEPRERDSLISEARSEIEGYRELAKSESLAGVEWLTKGEPHQAIKRFRMAGQFARRATLLEAAIETGKGMYAADLQQLLLDAANAPISTPGLENGIGRLAKLVNQEAESGFSEAVEWLTKAKEQEHGFLRIAAVSPEPSK